MPISFLLPNSTFCWPCNPRQVTSHSLPQFPTGAFIAVIVITTISSAMGSSPFWGNTITHLKKISKMKESESSKIYTQNLNQTGSDFRNGIYFKYRKFNIKQITQNPKQLFKEWASTLWKNFSPKGHIQAKLHIQSSWKIHTYLRFKGWGKQVPLRHLVD